MYKTKIADLCAIAYNRDLIVQLKNGSFEVIDKKGKKTVLNTTDKDEAIKLIRENKEWNSKNT